MSQSKKHHPRQFRNQKWNRHKRRLRSQRRSQRKRTTYEREMRQQFQDALYFMISANARAGVSLGNMVEAFGKLGVALKTVEEHFKKAMDDFATAQAKIVARQKLQALWSPRQALRTSPTRQDLVDSLQAAAYAQVLKAAQPPIVPSREEHKKKIFAFLYGSKSHGKSIMGTTPPTWSQHSYGSTPHSQHVTGSSYGGFFKDGLQRNVAVGEDARRWASQGQGQATGVKSALTMPGLSSDPYAIWDDDKGIDWTRGVTGPEISDYLIWLLWQQNLWWLGDPRQRSRDYAARVSWQHVDDPTIHHLDDATVKLIQHVTNGHITKEEALLMMTPEERRDLASYDTIRKERMEMPLADPNHAEGRFVSRYASTHMAREVEIYLSVLAHGGPLHECEFCVGLWYESLVWAEWAIGLPYPKETAYNAATQIEDPRYRDEQDKLLGTLEDVAFKYGDDSTRHHFLTSMGRRRQGTRQGFPRPAMVTRGAGQEWPSTMSEEEITSTRKLQDEIRALLAKVPDYNRLESQKSRDLSLRLKGFLMGDTAWPWEKSRSGGRSHPTIGPTTHTTEDEAPDVEGYVEGWRIFKLEVVPLINGRVMDPDSVEGQKLLEEIVMREIARNGPDDVGEKQDFLEALRWGEQLGDPEDLYEVTEEPRLRSLAKQTHWVPGRNEAQCLRYSGSLPDHTAPVAECECGFWLTKEWYHAPQAPGVTGAEVTVLAKVKGWGTVVHSEHGYRVQYARITGLYMNSPTWGWIPTGEVMPEIFVKAAERYGVEDFGVVAPLPHL